MDNSAYYNLANIILFGILTIAAIFIPLFFSIRAADKADLTLKDIIKIVTGIEHSTKSILSTIKTSTKTDVTKAISDFKDEIKPMLKNIEDKQKLDALAQTKIVGITNSIDSEFNKVTTASLSPSGTVWSHGNIFGFSGFPAAGVQP